ncbi:MAG: response regulator transcription factor [Poseidonibacter sp.]|uniref:response regulator transcription factor n=1 Tax=Poseidonibacter sp. TaxID=2321188 RepID=UPI00359EDADA
MKILLLEDDYSLNESITEILEYSNYEVDSFYDGLEALTNVSNKYDLYILDINTPSIEGIDILAHIKKLNPKSKVLMISAIIDIEKIREAYKLGCNDYIKKPFEIEELLLKVERLDVNIQLNNIEVINPTTKYCYVKKQLYINEEICNLTKNEKNFIYLLLKNKDEIISHQQIEDFVYDGENKSNDAIRSMVKRLRKKLSIDLIQNVLEEGYQIKMGF